MEKSTSFRDYVREQTVAAQPKIKREKKKRGRGFAWQVFFTLILGAIIWYVIGTKQDYFVSMVSNNIHYNVAYSQILEGINNIWNTLIK